MPYRRNSDAEESCHSDYPDSPVPLAPRHKYFGSMRNERNPRDWSKMTMPPARPAKKDLTFDASKYEFEFSPYDSNSSLLGYEGLLDMFPRPTGDDDESAGHVKRVSNMFFVFRTHFTKTYKNVLDPKTGRPRHPIPEKDISRMAAWVWNFQMTHAERRPYFYTYLQLKYEHEQDHPDYKYQPTRPQEAERIKAEKTRQRIEGLQRQKDEAAARRERDEQECKLAKVSKKKWAALKRERRKQNDENGLPDLRLDTTVSSDYASASPYSYTSTPLKSTGFLGAKTATHKAPSRSPLDPFVICNSSKEPGPMPMSVGWNNFNGGQIPSRLGTPGVSQRIEMPKLISTPVRQAKAVPSISPLVEQNGLGLQFPEVTQTPFTELSVFNSPLSFPSTTPRQTPISQNMSSSHTGQNRRPVAGLPSRAQIYDESVNLYDSMEYRQRVPPPPYTPPNTMPPKRARPHSPAVFNSEPIKHWQATLPVTPSPLSNSIAKERMIWGVSPQSDEVDRRFDFGTRSSSAPEEQDIGRGIISPRQARFQTVHEDSDENAFTAAMPPQLGHKRRVSETGQGGRSREPSYSAAPSNTTNNCDAVVTGAQDMLEDVFAAQQRALNVASGSGFEYLNKDFEITAGLFAGASADLAAWMGGSSLEYVPPSSQPTSSKNNMERDENNEDASPKSNINNSTDAFALVSTFAAEFVDGPEYENHVGDIATFTFVPFMPPCIPNPDMISPIRSFARSSRGDCGSPRHEFAMADGDSEKAMSQFFDFTSGSEASPRHLHSQVVSPVASEA